MDKIRVLEDALTNYLEVVESDGLKYLRKHSESYQQCKDRAAKILENDKNQFIFYWGWWTALKQRRNNII